MPATSPPRLRTALSAAAALALAAGLLLPAGAAAQADGSAADEATARKVLVIARSSSAVDAAVASSLVAAGLGDAVVFAESADALGADNAAIVGGEQPAGVLLIGGTAALSAQLEAEVRRLVDDVEIDRVAGDDRVHTAALAADRVLDNRPAAATMALANAWSPQDVGAAAAAVIAGSADAMLYSHDGWLSSHAASVLSTHRPEGLVVAGTPATFTHEMVARALLAAGSSAPPARLDGADGAAASAQAAQLAAPADIYAVGLVDIPDAFEVVVIAQGERPHDVSAALALAAAIDRSAVLLTHDAQLAEGAETLLLEHQPPHIVIFDPADDTGDSGLAELLATTLEQLSPAAAVSTVSTLSGSTRRALGGIPVADRSVRLGFASVSVGHDHVCGLRSNGTIACWGVDVGVGSTVAGGKARSPSGTYTAVTAGGTFTCAMLSDDTLDCWGSKDQWQVYTPDGRFVEITAGWGHACARFADNSVTCWGDQWGAEYLIPSGAPFLALSAGRHHTCGLEPSLNITCWGKAGDGQLAAPDGVFVAVAAGETHSCGLEMKGALECWGNRTGSGDGAAGVLPDAYAGRRYVSVSAGSGVTCALRPTQLIDCWDINGSDTGIQSVPRGFYTAVSAGGTFACALRTNTGVVCWGDHPAEIWDPFGTSTTTPVRQTVER